MDFINYYTVMGLAEPATPAAIKMAYRKLARKFHPDVSKEQDADARFKALGEAYAVLKDANKRTEYDLARASRSVGGKRSSAVAGVGKSGPGYGGGGAGDYFLEIQLAPHQVFVVAGRDVLTSLPVANWEVALGARVEVPTLAGPVNLTVPKETVSGSKVRLKGRGLGLNPTGDLIVHLEVMVPERHWTKAEMLYRAVADM